jgi:hypothetical protein
MSLLRFKEFFLEETSLKKTREIISEKIYYHGTTKDSLPQIISDKKLKSNSKGSRKISMGLTSENDFIYLTPSFNVAKEYAAGYEANMFSSRDEKFEFGGVVAVDLRDNIKLINFSTPLTDEQLEIVNSFLPSYKPIHKGETLSRFPWRSNKPEQLGDVVRALGFDGYIQNDNQIAILDEIPIRSIYDADWNRIL